MDRARMKEALRHLMEHHRGSHAAITMYQIYTHITGMAVIPNRKVNQTRTIRALIAELQREGMPIVHRSGSGGGYYLASGDEERQREARWHRSRAIASMRRDMALSGLTADELLATYRDQLRGDTTP